MKNPYRTHVFWGRQNPLTSLIGGSLLILASSRIAFAFISAGALLWVYGLTQGVFFFCGKFLPVRGRKIVLLFFSGFAAGVFILLLWFINPLFTMGTSFFITLAAPCYLGSGLYERCAKETPFKALIRSLREALTLGLLILAVAFIREPLGLGSLSFPGGLQGIVTTEGESPFPVRVLSVSAGGFLILGYLMALFKFFRNKITNAEDNS